MSANNLENQSSEADPLAEINAMKAVAEALQPLSANSRRGVLEWAGRFYGANTQSTAKITASVSGVLPQLTANSSVGAHAESPANLAELFSQARPGTDAEKALIAAYWFQKIEGHEDLDSFTLNSELTHLGHRLTNITRALSTLMLTKPALVVQTRKEGKTKQARKKYKLTVEGMRRVERMLLGAPSDGE